MADRSFPELPAPPPFHPTPVERVVPREPLRAIGELLAISIHDVVNDRRHKRAVAGFYRISRRIENDAWLRRQLDDLAVEGRITARR